MSQRRRKTPTFTSQNSIRRFGKTFHPRSSMPSVAATSSNGESNKIDSIATTVEASELQTKVTISFPSYRDLMTINVGEFVTSEPFTCGSSRFCVKLYPRGGGHGNSNNKKSSFFSKSRTDGNQSGFGMSYQVLPLFGKPQDQKVGMYLQYLPETSNDTVDATFALRLKGRQSTGRKFDVEWRAGMRFVALERSDLSQGMANDFGAHLMQTSLLEEFLGITQDNMDDATPVYAEVEVTIFESAGNEKEKVGTIQKDDECENDDLLAEHSQKFNDNTGKLSFFASLGKDIRTTTATTTMSIHDEERVRVGKIVVPILNRLNQRPRMFEIGAYPGVEYRILRILKDGKERFTSCPGAYYELKPTYPLVAQLERPWPVTVPEGEIPRLYEPAMYNAISGLGSLATALLSLVTAFWISQAVSFFFIPSRSMEPTLQVGDVLLVDKVSPRLFHKEKVGDVVLFSPPSKLRDIVSANGGKLSDRDLFVKRIAAAQAGDTVSVDSKGNVYINKDLPMFRRDLCEAEPLGLIEKYVNPKEEQLLTADEVFVVGDCSSVSIDSRVWGPLEKKNIVGRPILRLWPLERLGSIDSPPRTTIGN